MWAGYGRGPGGGREARVVFEWPGRPAERAEEGMSLGIAVGCPDGHAVVVQQVPASRLAHDQALALHHAHQADRALGLLVAATEASSLL